MAQKKTIRDEILEKWERNPPTWADIFAASEEHIDRIERDNARLQRRVDKLTAENKRLMDRLAENGE